MHPTPLNDAIAIVPVCSLDACSGITDDGMSELRNLKKLQYFNAGFCFRVSHGSLSWLTQNVRDVAFVRDVIVVEEVRCCSLWSRKTINSKNSDVKRSSSPNWKSN